MIMRLNRSSGVGGLAGVRARNGAVLRPLLGWRRDELVALALDADLPIVDDPSNSDTRFDRARLRKALNSQAIIDPQAAARAAVNLAEADAAIDWAVEAANASWHDARDRAVIREHGHPAELFRPIVLRRQIGREPCRERVCPDG